MTLQVPLTDEETVSERAQVSGAGQSDLRARPLLLARLSDRHYVNAGRVMRAAGQLTPVSLCQGTLLREGHQCCDRMGTS